MIFMIHLAGNSALGYVGGHGTAGLLATMLQNAGLGYWQDAQGVAITTATFGLVGGILLGMLLINISSRKGHTSILKKVSDIPQSYKIGYIKDESKQSSMGRETTLSASVDSLAFHLAIILMVCGLSYFVVDTVKTHNIFLLKEISIWAYAIVFMFIVWGIMLKLKLDFLVDDRTIDTHIKNLRKKIGKGAIKTIRGIGYKLDL